MPSIQYSLDTIVAPHGDGASSSQDYVDPKEHFVARASAEYKSFTENAEDEEDVEDIDALIEELQSLDGNLDFNDSGQDEKSTPCCISEELLQTDPTTGLTEQEVLLRRKKYGLNQMKEEKENLALKFLSYFVGPVQFVMEVRIFGLACRDLRLQASSIRHEYRRPQSWQLVSETGLILVLFVLYSYSMHLWVSFRSFRLDPLWMN